MCIGSMFFKAEPLFSVYRWGIKFGDVFLLVGGIPMYYEMIRLQIQLFRRLSVKDKGEL